MLLVILHYLIFRFFYFLFLNRSIDHLLTHQASGVEWQKVESNHKPQTCYQDSRFESFEISILPLLAFLLNHFNYSPN